MSQSVDNNSPCKWGGGNDYMACATCRIEYDYRKEPKPACGAEARMFELEKEASIRYDILMEIVKVGCNIQEGSSGHPVVWQSEACSIANKALGLTLDQLLAIGRAKAKAL